MKDLQFKLGKEVLPAGLAAVQVLDSSKICKVFMVCLDKDGERGA